MHFFISYVSSVYALGSLFPVGRDASSIKSRKGGRIFQWLSPGARRPIIRFPMCNCNSIPEGRLKLTICVFSLVAKHRLKIPD